MGAENIIRVLRTKIKGLQNEMEALQVDRNKQTEACRKLQVKVKALEDRNKWQQQAGMLRDSLKKQEILHSSTVAKLTQQESENLSLNKELESVRRELRTTVQSYKANEVQLDRSLEELKKL
ncbi:uncharacterized protein LOC111872736 [Cryptotermes secundus]|uniref:uncharacterized protein LOC111872736 n=1 Tax=Cryptotermes secundus TaxID=105785 RepID=UPI000CD7D50D|nr:uncharacterized protein LOC111872736 [Cryptotermes secundus]XP_033610706.1 uncharacterized protein LOC111872736 [Cryptotermes secundus]